MHSAYGSHRRPSCPVWIALGPSVVALTESTPDTEEKRTRAQDLVHRRRIAWHGTRTRRTTLGPWGSRGRDGWRRRPRRRPRRPLRGRILGAGPRRHRCRRRARGHRRGVRRTRAGRRRGRQRRLRGVRRRRGSRRRADRRDDRDQPHRIHPAGQGGRATPARPRRRPADADVEHGRAHRLPRVLPLPRDQVGHRGLLRGPRAGSRTLRHPDHPGRAGRRPHRLLRRRDASIAERRIGVARRTGRHRRSTRWWTARRRRWRP